MEKTEEQRKEPHVPNRHIASIVEAWNKMTPEEREEHARKIFALCWGRH